MTVMRPLPLLLIGAGLLNGSPVLAAEPPFTVRVVGTGHVNTIPEIATVTFDIVGEGTTPDSAVRNLARKRSAIEQGLASGGAVLPR